MILHVLLAALAGWVPRHQQQVITSLPEANRVRNAQVGGRQLRLTDTARRRLAALAYPLGRTRLHEVATMAPPDPLMRWYHRWMRRASGVAPITLPPWRPHRRADGERFVRSIKEAALQQMIVRGEASLRSALQSYLTHDHHERPRQGLAHHLIAREPAIGNPSGQVRRRARLGGLLMDDYGDAA